MIEQLGIAMSMIALLIVAACIFILRRLGAAVSAIDPSLWQSMKPGFHSDIRESDARRRRLYDFLFNKEYAQLQDAEVSRLAVACRNLRKL